MSTLSVQLFVLLLAPSNIIILTLLLQNTSFPLHDISVRYLPSTSAVSSFNCPLRVLQIATIFTSYNYHPLLLSSPNSFLQASLSSASSSANYSVSTTLKWELPFSLFPFLFRWRISCPLITPIANLGISPSHPPSCPFLSASHSPRFSPFPLFSYLSFPLHSLFTICVTLIRISLVPSKWVESVKLQRHILFSPPLST